MVRVGMALAGCSRYGGTLLAACSPTAFTAGYLLLCLAVFEATRVALPLTPMLGLMVFGVLRLLAPAGHADNGSHA